MAWAAGLFEGEGALMIMSDPTGRKRKHLRLAIKMTDYDVLERFHQIVEVGSITGPYRVDHPVWKPVWQWRIAGAKGRLLLADVRFTSHFGTRRRERLEEILSELDAQPEPWAHVTHCLNGHRYTPANTYRSPQNGRRSCRRCHADREAVWRVSVR